MPHRYDASTKYLLEVRLADWLPLSGRTTTAQLRIVDADVSTVTAAADRVLVVEEEEPWILHVEPQSGRDALLPARTQMYNTLIGWRHGLPVRSLIVLLRPAADGTELTGVFERRFPDESPYLVFHYQIVRLWQLPVERCLDGGLGLVPLAPLGAVTEAELPAVIGRMRQRIDQEATAEEAATLWTAADVLMGLRYSRELVGELLRGVQNMKESVTYQAIVEEGVEKGRLEATRQMLLDVGTERLGEPSEDVERAIGRIADLERLRRLGRRLMHVATWQELLAAT
jgi:hypothetical protein